VTKYKYHVQAATTHTQRTEPMTTTTPTPSGRWPVQYRDATQLAGLGLPTRDLWPAARVAVWLAAGVTPAELVDAVHGAREPLIDDGQGLAHIASGHKYASLDGVLRSRPDAVAARAAVDAAIATILAGGILDWSFDTSCPRCKDWRRVGGQCKTMPDGTTRYDVYFGRASCWASTSFSATRKEYADEMRYAYAEAQAWDCQHHR
jgi:hypothetical protein